MVKPRSNPKLKKYRLNLLTGFLAGLLLVLGIHLTLADRGFSEVENRTLKQLPAFSLTAFRDGSWQKNLSGYLADQFPLRDPLIRFKAGMERFLQRQENNDVYIHSRAVLIDKFKPNAAELIKEKAEVINAFAEAHATQRVSLMLVPNKIEILKDELPPAAPVPSQAKFLSDFSKLLTTRVNAIDLIDEFTARRGDYLYFRSDHHWTQTGAFVAQAAYFESLGETPRSEGEFEVRKVAQDFLGTLTAKSGITPAAPDDLELYVPTQPQDIVVNLTEEQRKLTSLYQMDLVDGQDKYLVYLGGNYPVVRIATTSTEDRRLLVIKDSYANAFVPFLTRDYNEITLVDLRYYTGDVNALVDEYLITDILILYNINTFHDDNAILNLGDTLDVPRVSAGGPQRPADTVALSSRFDPYVPTNLLVTLRNYTGESIEYQRRVQLEIKTGETWRVLTVNPAYPWDADSRTLGPSANAEYLVRMEEAFGELEPGTYRITQAVGTATATAEFIIEPDPLTTP